MQALMYTTLCTKRNVPDFEWERIFKLLILAIEHPLLLQEEFDAEFGNVREELSARSNNHFRQLGCAYPQSLRFGG